MAAAPTLLLYLNSDVGMERPYRTTLPASVDTLAELCQFLTMRIPPRPGEDTVGRGYRFLYSVLGKPLWRVKECIDAGTVVLSVGPGFLARRPTAITDGACASVSPAAAAATTANHADLTTPDRLAATSNSGANLKGNSNEDHQCGNIGLPLNASPSASPPIKAPMDSRFHSAAPPFFSSATSAAAANSTLEAAADVAGGASANAAFVMGAAGEQGRESIDVAWPPAPSLPRPSQADERDRLVSITINTSARGARASSGGPITQSTPLNGATVEGADGAVGHTTAVRLFTPPTAQGATKESIGGSLHNQTLFHQPPFTTPPPPKAPIAGAPGAGAAAAAPGDDLPRGMVFVAHDTHALPPRPLFTAAAVALQSALPHLQPLPSTSISSSLQYFLLRKWGAYQKLHSMPPAELVAGEAMSQQFNTITASLSSSSHRACRVVVSGPPRSGVSITTAFLLRHFLRTLQFQPQHSLHNTLVIALDFRLLFATQTTSATGLQHHAPPHVLLDLASLYQLVVRTAMDALVAQRPSLREAGPLLSQLWDLVIKPNVEPKVAPNFTTYTQAAALVGGDVLARWTRLGEQLFPVLQAACRTPEVQALRDAALDLIFYAIPTEMAASLNFSGVLYAIDGAEALTQCYVQRVERPTGDFGPLMQALTADSRTHLVLSWPVTLPPRTLFIPNLTAHVSTIGLVPREALNRLHFPQSIRSGRKEYPLELFLGCPGYLTHLYALVRPFRKNLTVPTTAYSSYHQQSYERSTADGYAVRIDSSEVSLALDKLLALVQHLPFASS
ncbi:hypothetical protein ABL78_1976 [Leptomonas seymouri]|uniref:Uncharacterized protein n=1 Tax=Leptomonas seymouri TaxID=5684 RepID=A0A0N1I868_LEPSE|nr:hypothetical protein ABL78_1976 [Leptomonas seymouri]|eukprot:KPI88931.1 hypothetical protein ABL78_1976 [Leptomonas seymouri]